MLTTLNKIFKSMKWLMLISGSMIVILGITMLFMPLKNLSKVVVFINSSMLVSGISEIASFCSEKSFHRYGWMLASGIITTLFTIWVLFGRGTEVLREVFPYAFALWVLFSGCMRIVGSIAMKSEGSFLWGWILAFGILVMVLGFLLLLFPNLPEMMVSCSMALMLISYGIDKVILFFRLKKIEEHGQDYFGRLP